MDGFGKTHPEPGAASLGRTEIKREYHLNRHDLLIGVAVENTVLRRVRSLHLRVAIDPAVVGSMWCPSGSWCQALPSLAGWGCGRGANSRGWFYFPSVLPALKFQEEDLPDMVEIKEWPGGGGSELGKLQNQEEVRSGKMEGWA